MTEAAKHTPTPWRVGDREPYVEVWGRMQMNSYPIIASLEHEPREANAAFIVKAVNAFEAQERLIETLTGELANTEEKLQAINWHRINRTVNSEIFADLIKSAIDDIRTALAQARKGTQP